MGCLDAKPLDRLGRRLPGLAEEASGLADAQPGRFGQALDRQWFRQKLACEGDRDADPVGRRFHR